MSECNEKMMIVYSKTVMHEGDKPTFYENWVLLGFNCS